MAFLVTAADGYQVVLGLGETDRPRAPTRSSWRIRRAAVLWTPEAGRSYSSLRATCAPHGLRDWLSRSGWSLGTSTGR
jgi:hypothetical protein